MAHDVFISYSRKDTEVAQKVYDALDAEGVECFFDTEDIAIGEDFAQRIANAVFGCKAMVFIWSDSSNQSPNTANEIALAIEFDKTIVPFKITKLTTASTLAYHLLKLNRIDAIPVEESHIRELVRKILQLLGKTEKSKQTKFAPTKTYKVGDYYDDGKKQGVVAKNPLFDVVLKKTGQAKLGVIKAVKELTGLSLGDAKALVDSAPRTVVERISKNEAESIKYALEEIGAVVAVVENSAQVAAKTYKVGDYYDVVLKSVGGNKLMVVKAVKEMFDLSLGDAKALVDATPVSIVTGVSSAVAQHFKSLLEEDGAEVAVVESGGQQNTPLAHKLQPATAKTYRVGDYYDDGKKKGVVFEVTASGKHGKIVSLTEAIANWAVNENFGTFFNRDNPSKKCIGADAKYDGANSMSKVKQIDGWREKYPAFAWCADLGEGWYLPAIEELKKFTVDKTIHDAVNRTLATKGKKLANKGDYWSSTELDEFFAWNVNMFSGGTYTISKLGSNHVRAVSAF